MQRDGLRAVNKQLLAAADHAAAVIEYRLASEAAGANVDELLDPEALALHAAIAAGQQEVPPS